jgi:hypothetical protein
MKPATQGGVREVLVAFMNDTSHQLYVWNKALEMEVLRGENSIVNIILFCTVVVSTEYFEF